jgi:hypothetical protein
MNPEFCWSWKCEKYSSPFIDEEQVTKLAYLRDMFDKLNELNHQSQCPNTHLSTFADEWNPAFYVFPSGMWVAYEYHRH